MLKKLSHELCKKLYSKYGCFEKIPTEFQLVMIVSTTAYICRNKNSIKGELESYLNEPVQIELTNKID